MSSDPQWISNWIIPFSISCRAGLMIWNYFSFCLSGTVLIFPLVLDRFAGYRILSWHFFLSTLNILAHCLSASKVSAWKSTYILIEDFFCVMSFLLLLSKFSPFKSLCVLVCVSLGLFHLELVDSCLSSNFGIYGHYFFK